MNKGEKLKERRKSLQLTLKEVAAAVGVAEATVQRWESGNIHTIRADRFLRNMVRAIVGSLIDVGKGKATVAGFEKIIFLKDRSAAGMSAPAEGLFLTDVKYPGSVEYMEKQI